MAKVVILHTNDIHGHLTPWKGWEGDLKDKTVGGFGRLAVAVAQARKEAKDALLLDAGDLLGDSMIADLTEGKAMVEALNHLGYDAMSIGNHEPDFGTAVLRQRMKDATFTVLAAILRRPVQPLPQDSAHMIVVKCHAEVPLNQNGDPSTGPQVREPTVGLRTLQEQGFQALVLFGGQTSRRTRMWFGRQAVRSLGKLEPAVNGSPRHAECSSHHLGALSPVDGFDGTTATPFQFRGRSKRSTHIGLELSTGVAIHWGRSSQ